MDKLSEEDRAAESTTTSLNVPYTQVGPGSILNTLNNIENIAIPGKKGMVERYPGIPGSGYNEFITTRDVEIKAADWATNYNTLPFLDKERINFVKQQFPDLKDKDPASFTVEERQKVLEVLKPYATKKVSSIKNAEGNATVRKTKGEF